MPVDSEIEGREEIQSQTPAIAEEVTNKFDEVFAKMDESDADEAGLAVVPAKNKSSARQSAEYARQQRVEEGIEDDDGIEPDEDGTEGAGATDTATEGTEAEEAEEKPAQEEQPVKDDVVAALDPNHVFAAQQLGWTPEKIAKLAKADPELAAETLATLSDTFNTLSRQLLNPGSPVAPGTHQVQQTPAQPASPTTRLDKFYAKLEEFTAANGEDLGEFVSALRDELIGPAKQMFADAESSREQARRTEAQTTMGALSGKFGDFYGAADKALTPAQQSSRAQLAQVADQLRAGAEQQGRPLSITEAINRAHLIVASQYQRQTVRTEIKNSLQKRAKSISAKPTHRGNPRAGSGTAAAEEVAARFWADKGNDVD